MCSRDWLVTVPKAVKPRTASIGVPGIGTQVLQFAQQVVFRVSPPQPIGFCWLCSVFGNTHLHKTVKNVSSWPGMEAHAFSSSAGEAETCGFE